MPMSKDEKMAKSAAVAELVSLGSMRLAQPMVTAMTAPISAEAIEVQAAIAALEAEEQGQEAAMYFSKAAALLAAMLATE